MANEVQVRTQIIINNGNLKHNPGQFQFTDDAVASPGLGPAPGAFIAEADGTDVDLSQFTTPAWIELANLENSDGATVGWGVYDVENDKYIPVGKLKPGWRIPFCLDELFGSELQPSAISTGTDVGNIRLRFIVKDAATAKVYAGAFEE